MEHTHTHDEFVEAVVACMDECTATELLQVPGAWEVFSEHFNNDALERLADHNRKVEWRDDNKRKLDAFPDLLEACKRALPYLASHVALTLDDGPGDRLAHDCVEAAIAKAEGQTTAAPCISCGDPGCINTACQPEPKHCDVCDDGLLVSDTCDDCNERHCSACEPCGESDTIHSNRDAW